MSKAKKRVGKRDSEMLKDDINEAGDNEVNGSEESNYNEESNHEKSGNEGSSDINIEGDQEIKKITFGKKTVAFAKLLWECMTYKMALFVVVAIYVIYVFSGFKTDIRKQINQNTKYYLKSMVQECLEKIEMRIHDEFIVLDTMGLFYHDDVDTAVTEELLNEAMKNHSFEGISLMDSEGKCVITLGNMGDYRDEELLESALAGNDTVSPIHIENGREFICLAVPVHGNSDTVNGVLMCNYDIKEFTQIMDTSSFEKLGTTLISEEDGLLVSRPASLGENDNLFELLDSININNEKSIKKLKKSITNGQSGIITYGKGKHKRYICYNVIPDTNWYAVSIVSSSSIEPVVSNVSKLAVNFTIHISLVVVGFILLTLAIDMKLLLKKRNG